MRKLGGLLSGCAEPGEIIKILFSSQNDPWLKQYAEASASKMVTHLFSDSGRTWREAARANGQGHMIYEALQNEMRGPLGGAVAYMVRQNAEYITSAPADIAREMTKHVMMRSMEGVRSSEIAAELLERYPDMTAVKANLIARTETAKTSTALTQSRSELLGLPWYEWHTSEDQRVRTSHRHMDHVLVRWDDPPSPEELVHEKEYGRYPPGGTFNCRCFASPVITLDAISWPHKVYMSGSITTMTRAQFERLWLPRMVG